MKKTGILCTIALSVLGGSVGTAQPGATTAPLWLSQAQPDNTSHNVRDRSGNTLTPGDQSSDKAYMDLTRHIRKAVVADKSLSTTAHNIKIITVNGVVTLRGPVK